MNNLCTYGGSSAPCSPETTAVNFTGNTYNSGSPNITIKTAGALSFSSLSSMTQTLGPVGCPQGVTYALSSNGTTWYYYTSSWTTTNGTAANTDTAAALSAQMSTFQAAAGSGKIYFSAFLKSNGLTPCTLQGITFGP